MKGIILLLTLCPLRFDSVGQSKVPAREVQIKSALLSAPADKKGGAAIYGYSANKEVILLRKGSNELMCLADDPNQAEFSVACYHRDLDPFMKRGRELRKLGKSTKEIFDTREKEVKSRKLIMPKQPATLYVYSAADKDYNRETGEVKNGYLRYVIYTPYATAESTGLPLKPETPGMPWIMNPGTHGAHIMINPPDNNSTKK